MNDFSYQNSAQKYEVWQIDCNIKTQADILSVQKPDGTACNIDFFYNIPIRFVYDIHGYETLDTDGEAYFSAKFCPQIPGEYSFNVYSNGKIIKNGKFICKDSQNHGFIKVCGADKRYFEHTDSTTFIPVGINMVYPTSYQRSDGTEFGVTAKTDTLGMYCYERWIKQFAESGGNYLRIWLGHEYFNIDTEIAGVFKYEQFAKIDKIISLAKQYGIKLKFTIEQFRYIGEKSSLFIKRIKTKDAVCKNADEWLSTEIWQNAWKEKVKEYLVRYSNEPAVAVWELWNEMLCFDSSSEKITKWTAETVKFIKKFAPHQLVTTSFGSLNPLHGEKWYNAHFLNELDFLQVHRYLDQGEKEELRRTDPILNTVQAVKGISTGDRPAVLAETGAVNNNHSGPFRYYLSDDRGIIFADTVYPAFFAGSAGCGQIWHWDDRYVSAKGLYKMFAPFAKLINGINPSEESFIPNDLSNSTVCCMLLKGKNTTLGYIRNRSDNWQSTLRDLREPEIIEKVTIDFESYDSLEYHTVEIWQDDTTEFKATNTTIEFKNIKYGAFFIIKNI